MVLLLLRDLVNSNAMAAKKVRIFQVNTPKKSKPEVRGRVGSGWPLKFGFFRLRNPEKKLNFKHQPDPTRPRTSGSVFSGLLTRKPELQTFCQPY